MRYCGQCGSPNLETSRFCTNCGAKLRDFEAEPATAEQDVTTAQSTTEAQEGAAPDNLVAAGAVATPEATPVITTVTATDDCTATYAHPQFQQAPVYTAPQQSPTTEPAKSASSGDISALSIIAFIFAFIVPIAGLIMGIIDLCITDGRKKGLSIAAVVISALATVVFVVAVILPMSFILGAL